MLPQPESRFSKSFGKKLRALDDAKGRARVGLFVAEGSKCVSDLTTAYTLRHLLATEEWLREHPHIEAQAAEVLVCSPAMLKEASRLNTAPQVVGLFALPAAEPPLPDPSAQLVVALDCIQDPGNLGTIVRTCDWMGVRAIVASPDTVDVFNPKAVQASMGAIAQVKVCYTPLPQYLSSLPKYTPIYGTFLGGEDAYKAAFAPGGVLVMGNEGRGIRPEVEALVTNRLTIPAAPGACAESLNVGIATAMLLALRQKSLM